MKAPGVKYCQIPKSSTFVSFCHSFLRIVLQSRTLPLVTCSTTETLTLEILFILLKNYSEVLSSYPLIYLTITKYIVLSESLSKHDTYYLNSDGYFNPEVVKYRQLCAKSQKKRQLYSLQQYYHRLLKQILVSRKVFFRNNLKYKAYGLLQLV